MLAHDQVHITQLARGLQENPARAVGAGGAWRLCITDNHSERLLG